MEVTVVEIVDDPSLEERLMIGMLRQCRDGKGDFRMVIELRDGAWEIKTSVPPHDKEHSARGVGQTFDDAWNDMNPTSA